MTRIAYHEAGHAIIARYFARDLEVKEITLSPNLHYTMGHPMHMAAGVCLILPRLILPHATSGHDNTIDVNLKFIKTHLAGWVTQTIYRDGFEGFRDKRNEYLQNHNLFYNEGVSEDFRAVALKIDNMLLKGYLNNRADIIGSSLNFLFEFLVDREGWKYVVAFSEALLGEPEKLFEGESLEGLFNTIGCPVGD